MKKSKKDYDFTGLAYEITGDALYQINGGAVIENSIKAQSEAHEGDFVTNSRNETHKLTQDEIDWAKAEMARREQASATSDPSSNSSPSNKANTNKNSAKDNRETELCINPSNYQDQPTDERGYYSTTANYKNTTASESNAMKGSVTEGNAFVEFKEVSSSYESINSKKKVNGQVTLGVNLNAVAMIGFDASIGLQFNLDDSSKSGLLLSGGFASGVSLGASLFAGYNSGKVDAKNLVTISVTGTWSIIVEAPQYNRREIPGIGRPPAILEIPDHIKSFSARHP